MFNIKFEIFSNNFNIPEIIVFFCSIFSYWIVNHYYLQLTANLSSSMSICYLSFCSICHLFVLLSILYLFNLLSSCHLLFAIQSSAVSHLVICYIAICYFPAILSSALCNLVICCHLSNCLAFFCVLSVIFSSPTVIYIVNLLPPCLLPFQFSVILPIFYLSPCLICHFLNLLYFLPICYLSSFLSILPFSNN